MPSQAHRGSVPFLAGGATGAVYAPATGTWTTTGPMVYPYASAAVFPSAGAELDNP
jgi:hypothetical protein